MAQSLPFPQYDLPRAGRALQALMRDPDDLPQVFTLIESISGTAPHRLLWKFKRTASGARLLREQPDIVPAAGRSRGAEGPPRGFARPRVPGVRRE